MVVVVGLGGGGWREGGVEAGWRLGLEDVAAAAAVVAMKTTARTAPRRPTRRRRRREGGRTICLSRRC